MIYCENRIQSRISDPAYLGGREETMVEPRVESQLAFHSVPAGWWFVHLSELYLQDGCLQQRGLHHWVYSVGSPIFLIEKIFARGKSVFFNEKQNKKKFNNNLEQQVEYSVILYYQRRGISSSDKNIVYFWIFEDCILSRVGGFHTSSRETGTGRGEPKAAFGISKRWVVCRLLGNAIYFGMLVENHF